MTAIAAGIDLSGRTVGTTAIAWLGGESDQPQLIEVVAGPELSGERGDTCIAHHLTARRPELVAIDAPLTLPHAVTCIRPSCAICFPVNGIAPSYGSRALDRAESWKAAGHTEKPPMPTVMVAGIALRAIYLRRLLEREGLEVIETWPMGVYRVIARRTGDLGEDTGDVWRRELLESRVRDVQRVDAEGFRGSLRDRLDAVAAAYAAWSKLQGKGCAVSSEADPSEGAIWVPDPARSDDLRPLDDLAVRERHPQRLPRRERDA